MNSRMYLVFVAIIDIKLKVTNVENTMGKIELFGTKYNLWYRHSNYAIEWHEKGVSTQNVI